MKVVAATPPADPPGAAASSSIDSASADAAATCPQQHESITPYVVMLIGAVSFAAMGHFTHALHNDVPWQYVALFRNVCVLALTLGLA
ncbi:MAG TPA: hypothetical protein VGE52_03235, partial [Pirellulales bacterium]